jgi:hypothetical protein
MTGYEEMDEEPAVEPAPPDGSRRA